MANIMAKVFLGGPCYNSNWRDKIIPQLKIDYFNPIENYPDNYSAQKELNEIENCDFCLYTVTPKMKGVFSIAEAVDDSYKRPKKTLFFIMPKDGEEVFSSFQVKSLSAIGKMIRDNGGYWFENINDLIEFLNSYAVE